MLAERLLLPSLLGLLMFGAVIGPNMLDVLPRFAGLQAVGSIGVLYVLFLDRARCTRVGALAHRDDLAVR